MIIYMYKKICQRVLVVLASLMAYIQGIRHCLENCIAKAKELNIQSGLITFDPDPWKIFFPDRVYRHITTLEDRIHLASVMGIEVMYVITF